MPRVPFKTGDVICVPISSFPTQIVGKIITFENKLSKQGECPFTKCYVTSTHPEGYDRTILFEKSRVRIDVYDIIRTYTNHA